ncbi:bifunctional polysaccharide deacetylase/glycosyltransferase family 2 protein [Aeromicrobium sp.]|uniref:bifunctional polysaccharide deacetylase/glycosyltransferase family 2 protein n=1 Tax=Aeromicrobium sp. TaxID=1871063 RepID=UPI001990FFE4|nr:bifunctional polysaccharide deacetylase/glycosyltransferase family 2 protein [Aeromicrobium sp.]MBC7633389.1 glycosyltransferase [Aeromicrobium sp.]
MTSRDLKDPRVHWFFLIVLLTGIFLLLVVSGYTSGQLGEGDNSPASEAGGITVPNAVREGGPILDPSRPDAPGIAVPDKTVVLTFDDGPTSWTPRILDVLDRQRVKATFFVIGSHVAQKPDVLRRMVDEGHEVGVHTFTHVNLANVPTWRQRLELDQTQFAIAAVTGRATDLLRPPYSSTVDGVTPSDWRALVRSDNYRVVLTDLDTKDWQKPGVDKITAAGTPRGNTGAVVMLHDGGGNRAQTAAGLDKLIVDLKSRGYRFETVTQAAGVRSPWHPADQSEEIRGHVVISLVRISDTAVTLLLWMFILLAALAVARTLLLLTLARRHARTTIEPPFRSAAQLPGVTVVVPAYNEELGIEAAVRSLVNSDYPLLEIIVVDDGSTDATSAAVEALGLPGVTLIRQANAGKPAALNTGIAAAKHDVLVLVDGDTVFEPDAMRALVAPLADPRVGAVSGNTKVGNRGGLLGRWQHIEYVIGFNLDRRMFDVLQCMPTVPGAIGAFRRSVLDDVGGVSDDTLAEDTDLTMAICRAGWRVVYAPEARAWTEAPSSLGQLWRQRYRWCYGTMQAMWKHKRAAIERGASGKLGRRGLPYLLAFQVLLPLLAPVIDVAALYSVVFLPSPTIAYVWLAFLALQYVSAAYAFILDRESLRPLWTLVLQQVVYRQLMYLVVIQSVASAIYGIRLQWQKLRRTGDMHSAPITVSP